MLQQASVSSILTFRHEILRRLIEQKPDQKPKLLSGPTTSTIKSASTANGEEDFYTMFQRINANALSEADMIKLIAAMKQVRQISLLIRVLKEHSPFDLASPYDSTLVQLSQYHCWTFSTIA